MQAVGMSTANQKIGPQADAVRAFNRFYTKEIGLLNKRYLKSAFSLTQVRVLYELAHQEGLTAGELGRQLGLDAGYLSRILARFEQLGYVKRQVSASDARQMRLAITRAGRKVFAPLDQMSHDEVAAMLSKLDPVELNHLVEAMGAIERILGERAESKVPYLLRQHQPGDMGWVIHRHGALYAQEYGWDERFEALVAEIAAKFIQNFDSKRERCWIAERNNGIVGSVFLVKHTETIAKLRLLLVEPSARGLGIGKRLVNECVRFGRQTGYRRITLWTQSVLLAARKLYEKAGFRMVEAQPNNSFGYDLISETWELDL